MRTWTLTDILVPETPWDSEVHGMSNYEVRGQTSIGYLANRGRLTLAQKQRWLSTHPQASVYKEVSPRGSSSQGGGKFVGSGGSSFISLFKRWTEGPTMLGSVLRSGKQLSWQTDGGHPVPHGVLGALRQGGPPLGSPL